MQDVTRFFKSAGIDCLMTAGVYTSWLRTCAVVMSRGIEGDGLAVVRKSTDRQISERQT